MKPLHTVILAAALIIASGIVVAQPRPNWGQNSISPELAQQATRACTLATGTPVRLQATTGTDADSGALSAWTVYRVDADTDAWIATGASAVTAAANGHKVRAGIPEYFLTTDTILHVSALSVSSNGDVRLSKCQ